MSYKKSRPNKLCQTEPDVDMSIRYESPQKMLSKFSFQMTESENQEIFKLKNAIKMLKEARQNPAGLITPVFHRKQ